MSVLSSEDGARENALSQFLVAHGYGNAQLLPLQQDASNRRYFRFQANGKKLILMDAPPATEKPLQFEQTTRYLSDLGARVPALAAVDTGQGLLVLEDLGDLTFTRLLDNKAEEAALYCDAVAELTGIQNKFAANARRITLPAYDLDATLVEARLFADWYIPARIGRTLSALELTAFEQIWRRLFAARPDLPAVMVHRDYHVDNLLMVDGRCAMLDYQDALLGSPLYDLVSLLEDARRDVSAPLQVELVRQWRSNQTLVNAIPDHEFANEYQFWGAQRHCKVAGIFVRLWLRDGKDSYLRHLARVMSLLEKNIGNPEMQPLRQWIEELLPEITHTPFNDDRPTLVRALQLPRP